MVAPSASMLTSVLRRCQRRWSWATDATAARTSSPACEGSVTVRATDSWRATAVGSSLALVAVATSVPACVSGSVVVAVTTDGCMVQTSPFCATLAGRRPRAWLDLAVRGRIRRFHAGWQPVGGAAAFVHFTARRAPASAAAASLLLGRGLLLQMVAPVAHGRRSADVELAGRVLMLA